MDLPHSGAVVGGTEGERISRLVSRLNEELTRRQELLARFGHSDINEQRRAIDGEPLSFVLILVDRWEALSNAFPMESGSEVVPSFTRFVREGTAAGFRVVLAGDRSLLSDRIASHIDHQLIFRLNDPNDYRIAGINPRTLPEYMAPGRALLPEGASEVQMALLAPDASGTGQREALLRIASNALRGRSDRRPIRVDVLPRRVTFNQLDEFHSDEPDTGNPRLTSRLVTMICLAWD